MNGPTTLLDAVFKAKEIFHRNSDTLIAGFLVRHPDVDPADVELVFTPGTDGSIKFSIEPKELHVPPVYVAHNDYGVEYANGWNACRNAMIAKSKAFRAPEAMVSILEAAT